MDTKKAARRDDGDENVGKFERAQAKVKAKKAQDPLFPEPGAYECTYLGLEIPEVDPGMLEWCRVAFEHEGNKYVQLHCMTGKSLAMSLSRLKALQIVLVDADSEEEYDEWDPKCKFLSALQGIENGYTEFAQAAAGRAKVRVVIAKGGDTEDGDWYRNASYGKVGSASDDDDDEPESEAKPKAKKGKRK